MLSTVATPNYIAMAANEITIVPVQYQQGKPLKVLADGESLGINAATVLAYDINFEMPPTVFELHLGGWKSDTGEIELHLDTMDGPLIGSVHTKETFKGAWEKKSVLIQNTLEFKGKHTIWLTPKSGIHDFHYMKITVPSASDVYYDFSTANGFDDITNRDMQNEISILCQLGAFSAEDADFNPNGIALKDDLIRGIAAFYNSMEIDSTEKIFADVTTEHTNYKSYAKLVSMGLLEKAPDSKFNVNSSITLSESIPILLKLLNCEHLLKTGKSSVVIANELDLLDGISCGYNAKMRRFELAKLLYNAIESDYLAVEYIKNNRTKYKKQRGILSATCGIYEGDGVITATSSNNLYSTTQNAPAGTVIIDNNIFEVGDSSAASYIGFRCTYLYEETGNGKKLIAVAPSKRSEYIQLFSEDVMFNEISDNKISYYKENGRTIKLETSGKTVIMFNGRPADDKLENLVDTEKFQGNILMINNDGDSYYDVVLVESAETIIFGGVSGQGVYDELRGEHIVASDINNIRTFKNGVGFALKDVTVGSVVDVYRSKNITGDVLIRMYVSEKQVEGVVSSVDENYIYIDELEKLKIYDEMITPVEVGGLMRFNLNGFGTVISAEPVNESNLAVVLTRGTMGDGLFKTVGMKLLTSENKVANFEIAQRMYFDGYLCDNEFDLLNGTLNYAGVNNLPAESLIRYRLDKDGRIKMIDTPSTGKGGINDTLTELMAKSADRCVPYKAIRMRTDQVDIVPIADNCKTAHLWASGEYDSYSFVSGAPQGSGEMELAAYSTIGNTMYADVILWSNRAGGDNVAAFVFDKKITKLDDNGNEYVMLGGYSNGGYKQYKVSVYSYANIAGVKTAIDALAPGDIISFATDAKGEVYDNIVFIMFADGSQTKTGFAGITPQMHNTQQAPQYTNDNRYGIRSAGTVIERDGDYIKIERNHGGVISHQVVNLSD